MSENRIRAGIEIQPYRLVPFRYYKDNKPYWLEKAEGWLYNL